MNAMKTGSTLVWEEVDTHHLRARTELGYNYDIIHTPDGQVSWQGEDFGVWNFVVNVDAAKAAAAAEFAAATK